MQGKSTETVRRFVIKRYCSGTILGVKNRVQGYVSLRLRVQNAVPAQPCVGQLEISLVLLNFCIVILDYGLKLHKLSNHTLVMLQK